MANVVVNGIPCRLVYIPDADGFHDFYAIPEDSLIVKEIDENFDGRMGSAYLSKELLDEIIMFDNVDCMSVMSDED